jgi:acyl-CoA synthetase (AMP-forming)/AMP-acid ligase II
LVDRHGGRPAVVDPLDGRGRSFAELRADVRRLSARLHAAGVGPHDRVASLLPNGPTGIELPFAVGRLGATTIGVNTRSRAADLRHVLERGRPRILAARREFLGIDFEAIVAEARSGLTDPPSVLWEEELVEPVEEDDGGDGARPTDLLVAFTTSGTTGRPKLAAHDHVSTIRHLAATARWLEVDSRSVTVLLVPFCGTFGFVSALSVLAGGGCVVVPDHFDPVECAALARRHRATHLNGSDDMLLAIMDQDRGLSTWRRGVVADFTSQAEACVRRAEPTGTRLTGVYGSSETFALLAGWSPAEPALERARSGGRMVDGSMEARVVDGELQVRGPSVLQAYLAEEGTAPPPLDDGWLATGDLAEERRGGFVFVARMGDALRLAGFLTDPAEIEQHLVTHPAVAAAQVVGVTGPGGREVAVAFVTLHQPVMEAGLIEHCSRDLANYKVPARVAIVDAFPTVDGPNGVKIRKADLRAMAADLLHYG